LNRDFSRTVEQGKVVTPVASSSTSLCCFEKLAGSSNQLPTQRADASHDLGAKHFLGCSPAAGRSTQQDVNAALDCVFAQPNPALFMAMRLTRNLVTNNPNPAYIADISAAFNNNRSSAGGDLQAVVRAVLLDSESRPTRAPTSRSPRPEPVGDQGLIRPGAAMAIAAVTRLFCTHWPMCR